MRKTATWSCTQTASWAGAHLYCRRAGFIAGTTAAGLKADIGYLGRKQQITGPESGRRPCGPEHAAATSTPSGALTDSAEKVFRGTIDFKNGSAGSTGSEQETVLLLGDDVVNKTVPLILCAEENVEGNHGATIGELDDETLFYFESRGIGREAAENLMARAAVERLAREYRATSRHGRSGCSAELNGGSCNMDHTIIRKDFPLLMQQDDRLSGQRGHGPAAPVRAWTR